ncbi:hypothetical protein CA51_04270 [Rosistilla oblonga]|nr:hypothetical protein CA51_04270 [Rosistilla oblonga]
MGQKGKTSNGRDLKGRRNPLVENDFKSDSAKPVETHKASGNFRSRTSGFEFSLS